ncbi:MAG: Fpg/Nei family DNA glycosylase [Puniceicoccaceae bacterium]|nr:MAG: Fpg/Nei family DNA glycosylase [Puniceicoccaceae bacterium]
MPELPEVKTIQDQLNCDMPFRISRVQRSRVAGSIIHTPLPRLVGRTITHIERTGKLLDFRLDDGRQLLSHLGMSGAWLIASTPITEKHTHLQFQGESPAGVRYLAYVDPRRFGHMYLYTAEQAAAKLSQLGHDLLSPLFTLKYFTDALLKYPQRMIKVTLLDQSLFAGSGNYIANEICAHGRVRPNRQVHTLSRAEIKRLHQGVHQVLSPTIGNGGTAFGGGYRDANGERGTGVQHLVVFYQSTCQLCRRTPVVKTILAQRGTYHCPRCQR